MTKQLRQISLLNQVAVASNIQMVKRLIIYLIVLQFLSCNTNKPIPEKGPGCFGMNIYELGLNKIQMDTLQAEINKCYYSTTLIYDFCYHALAIEKKHHGIGLYGGRYENSMHFPPIYFLKGDENDLIFLGVKSKNSNEVNPFLTKYANSISDSTKKKITEILNSDSLKDY
jgi:hypothetical protein